ncbi:MAG: hypothetical protein ACI90V_012607, partial [Bacillariaceae sp.]
THTKSKTNENKIRLYKQGNKNDYRPISAVTMMPFGTMHIHAIISLFQGGNI